jgi:hypothetical protein
LEINFSIAGGALAPEDNIRQQELGQKRRYWNTQIESWHTSRLRQTEHFRQHELKIHQFVYWRRSFAHQTARPISLVQVPAAAVARAAGYFLSSAALRAALAPDVCIEVSPGFDPQTLLYLAQESNPGARPRWPRAQLAAGGARSAAVSAPRSTA